MGDAQGHIPIRTCIACGAKRPKEGLLRFVLTRETGVVEDRRGRLPGRGAYICNNKQCLEQAVKKNRLNKAFRKKGALSVKFVDGVDIMEEP